MPDQQRAKNFLGLDIGTSHCKAVVFNSAGKQLTISQREYKIIFSQEGWAELDSNEVIEKCFQVILECSQHVEPDSIIGLGISSQGEAFTAIGENGDVLCNAMVSSDTRSKLYIEQWEKIVRPKELYDITGHTSHPMFTLFKLLWLKENKADLWKKTKKILCFEDLLQYRLGLDPIISHSMAGRTMMFDIHTNNWSDAILESLGLSAEKLATPKPSGTIVGQLSGSMAEKLGLSTETYIVSGGHDQVCGALGAGITKPGMAIYATGTVECITPVMDEAIFSDVLYLNNLCTNHYAIQGMYCTVAFNLTGGNILKWYRDELGAHEIEIAKTTGRDVYELLLDYVENKPSGLLVLPYFTPSGTPYFDTHTKGAILGLRLTTKKNHLIRALLEGISYEMRLNLEILESAGFWINELRVVGGGAKSKKWAQLKADVLGKKIVLLKVTEAGCMGAAMLACAATTDELLDKLALEWAKPLATIFPQPENKAWYDRYFKSYKKLYKLAKEIDI